MTTPETVRLLLEELGAYPCQFTCCKSTTNSHGCPHFPDKNHEDLSRIKPVLIGDVLEELQQESSEFMKNEVSIEAMQVIRLWSKCGFTTSLQSIIEASGWEDVETGCMVTNCQMCFVAESEGGEHYMTHKRLRSEPARNLCELLITLFTPGK